MLDLVTGPPCGDCGRIGRREFIRIGALGGLTLPGLFSARAQAAAAGSVIKDTSVVLLFLTGGPSHIETFDPKMSAPSGVRSVTGAVSSNVPGVALGGTFTELAQHVDKMALVRSFCHGTADHTLGVQTVMRGGNPLDHSGMGAVATRLRGTSHPRTGMPTHVYLCAQEVDRQFNKERLRLLDAAGPGGLGGAYAPFQVGGDQQLNHDMTLRLSRARLQDRLALQRSLDRFRRQLDAGSVMRGFDKFEQQALEVILGKSRRAFDLTQEDPRLVERYDTSRHITGIHKDRPSTLGHQLLLARRLCEAGCGFITIHNPGWDMHGGPTQYNVPDGMEALGRPVDHAVSAFLEDVHQRGLSEKILLIITGEFGRTPKVKPDGGRDHWPRLSTLALAGGGLRMGQVVGDSNAKAEEPRRDPVTPDHLLATVMHVLFDVPSLRVQRNIPREIASLLGRNAPIAQLI